MKATVTAHKDFVVSKIDDRVYGAFLEHMGRAIYTGIYEPDHPEADENGMRTDVIELVKELNVPVVRYPGGNFVSAFNWEDSIGPKEDRPVRLDLAWHSSESNQVGVHEFADWCATVGTEMMMAVNLGSRGLDAARNLVEYVNHPGGSYWSDLRIANGRKEPWNVKLWCLGNEMDGPWQVGHKTAEEYGHLANETAKAIRGFDRNLELVVCGSSSADMPTYPAWEATVLEATYDAVDYISLHMYFANREDNTPEYLALGVKLENYINSVAGVISYVKAKKRSDKDVYISFDEWNVWYHSNEQDKVVLEGKSGWPHHPPILEDIYNFEDVLQVGCILNAFIRRADVVKIACIAQLVNVIAPIMTVPGGGSWRQSIFYPYMYASVYGRGEALDLKVNVPGYKSKYSEDTSYIDISAVRNDDGHVTFFVVSRNPDETIDIDLNLEGFEVSEVSEHLFIKHDDLKASNSIDNPHNIVPQKGDSARLDNGKLSLSVAPYSYHVLRVKA